MDNVIEIAEQWEEELAASAVELTVEVWGSHVFSGQAAIEKAKEVRELRNAVVDAGVAPDAVSLVGLRAEVRDGFFSKSSSAHYTLRVRVDDLDRLAGVFDAVVSSKQARLQGVHWVFEPSLEQVSEWLARCARRAKSEARALAEAVGHELQGVAFGRSQILGRDSLREHAHVQMFGPPAKVRMGRASLAEDLDTAELAPTRRMGVKLEMGFTIRGGAGSAPGPR
ncbi:MAG: SIMPL domain-containing protein [Myxococcota bacterium]